MSYKEIATPSRTQEILKHYGFSLKKSLGQNFLTDPSILRNIVAAADLTEPTNVIEVGPGIGALTEHLAQAATEVLAFEIDQRLMPVLADTLAPYENVTVMNEDILQVDLVTTTAGVFKADLPLKVVANLPYYITTPIMMHLLESALEIDEMVIMMQKEVGERITAKPSTKAYGSLSIAVQYYMEASIAFIVPKTAFVPQPKIDSAIVKLTRRATPAVSVINEANFFRLTKISFAQRRKTLWNNLLSHFGKEEEMKDRLRLALEVAGIDPVRRGETLSLQEFADLANALEA